MGKCCGDSCVCKIVGDAESYVNVTGTGTPTDPFIISGLPLHGQPAGFTDSDGTIVITIEDGVVQFSLDLSETSIDELGDVLTTGATVGKVLAWNGTNWVPTTGTTAAAGSVLHDASLTGDGSAGNLLQVQYDPDGLIALLAGGIGISETGLSWLVRHYADSDERDGDTVTPEVGALSVLETDPQQLWVWGSLGGWGPLLLLRQVTNLFGQLLELSGPYAGGPFSIITKQVNDTTDASGVLPLIADTELVGYAGVIAVTFMPESFTGVPYIVTYDVSGGDAVDGVVWAVDGSGVMASSPVSGVLTAYVY